MAAKVKARHRSRGQGGRQESGAPAKSAAKAPPKALKKPMPKNGAAKRECGSEEVNKGNAKSRQKPTQENQISCTTGLKGPRGTGGPLFWSIGYYREDTSRMQCAVEAVIQSANAADAPDAISRAA